jgi:predicted signal transduction protein with EAL and GGDEF domain
MTLADQALYRAKDNGRDRAVLVMAEGGQYTPSNEGLRWIDLT